MNAPSKSTSSTDSLPVASTNLIRYPQYARKLYLVLLLALQIGVIVPAVAQESEIRAKAQQSQRSVESVQGTQPDDIAKLDVIKKDQSESDELLRSSRADRVKRRCERRGGEVKGPRNDGSFACTYYSVAVDDGAPSSAVSRGEPSVFVSDSSSRRRRRRRCVRHGGTYTQNYSANGDKLEGHCSLDSAIGSATPTGTGTDGGAPSSTAGDRFSMADAPDRVAINLTDNVDIHSGHGKAWLVRALAGWNSLSGPTEVLVEGHDRVTVGATDEIAFGIEIERRLTPRLGVELGILNSRPRFEANIDLAPREDETGFYEGQHALLVSEAAFRPITAGLNIHLTPERRVDLTLTPLAGYAFYDDLSFSFAGERTTLAVDDDFVWGLRLGADIPLGEGRWGVSLGARYLDASMDATDAEGDSFAIGLDPVIFTAGVSLRWPRSGEHAGEGEGDGEGEIMARLTRRERRRARRRTRCPKW